MDELNDDVNVVESCWVRLRDGLIVFDGWLRLVDEGEGCLKWLMRMRDGVRVFE